MKKIIIFSVIFISLILGLEFFLKSGFYMFLDTIFYPVYNIGNIFDKSFYFLLNDIFVYYFGFEIYSKIFLIIVLSFGAYLGYLSSRYILDKFEIKDEKLNIIIPIIGIVFSLSSPFIYERLVTQVGIAFGFFLFGIGFINILKFLENNLNKYIYLGALFLGLSFCVFPHILVFLIILGLFLILFFIKKFSFKNILFSIFIVFLLNFNWLFGSIFTQGENKTLNAVKNFNYQNIEVFRQNEISNLGVELTSGLLYGFWGELGNRIITPDITNKYWFLFGFLVLFIIGIGIFNLFKKDRRLTIFLILLGIVSFILALGMSSEKFMFINKFLFDNIPYYIGMREPSKLLGFLAIIYLIFFISGNILIIEKLKYYSKNYDIKLNKYLQNWYVFIFFIIFVILSWSPNVLFGFNGQLKIIKYPQEYLQAREVILENNLEKTLILPWHAYMGCGYNYARVISNPMSKILSFENTVHAENLEMGNLYSNIKTPLTDDIELFIKNGDLNLLKKHNIDNIVFQKNCGNFKIYDFLYKSKSLEIINSKDQLDIFLIK